MLLSITQLIPATLQERRLYAHFTGELTEAQKGSVTGLGLQSVFSEQMKESAKEKARERKRRAERREKFKKSINQNLNHQKQTALIPKVMTVAESA